MSAPGVHGDPLDVARIKKEFPILAREIKGHRLVYLDSASSSQKPRRVLDAMATFQETSYANVHRGVYEIAAEATDRYEAARGAVARFVNAPSPRGIVFAKNVTEAINLVAHSWGRTNLQAGDAVVLTEMEHHANLVPWLMLAEERGIELRYFPVAEDHTVDLTDADRLLDGDLVDAAVDVGVRRLLEPLHGVEHQAGLLRRRRRVEVDEPLALHLAGQDREVLLDALDVEGVAHAAPRNASYPSFDSCSESSGPPLATIRPSTMTCTRSGRRWSRRRW